LVILGGTNNRRNRVQPGTNACPPTSLAHNHFEAFGRNLAHDNGLQEADFLYGVSELLERLLVEALPGLPRIGNNLMDWNFGKVRIDNWGARQSRAGSCRR
jgi:hypothetical protein